MPPSASSNGHRHDPGPALTLRTWAIEAESAASIARALVGTAFIPETLRRYHPAARDSDPRDRALDLDTTVATVAAALLTGTELGFSPMASLRVIDIIKNTPALRAVGLRALLLSHGHQILVAESTATRARVRACRAGTDTWQESTWTIDRARQLGVAPGKPDGQWRRQPQAMLVARATAEVSRWVAADAMLGLPLIAEEVDPDATETTPATDAEPEPEPEAPAPKRQRKPTPRVALPAAPPATVVPPPGVPPPQAPHDPDPGPEPGAGMITGPQRAKLHILLREAGITDRAEIIGLISAWTGREDVTTSNQLTAGEASMVIDRLQRIADEQPQEQP